MMTVGTWWSQDAAPWAAAALLEIVLGLAVRASVACRLGVLGVTVVGLRPDVEVLLRHVRHGRLAFALTDAVEALAEKLHGLLPAESWAEAAALALVGAVLQAAGITLVQVVHVSIRHVRGWLREGFLVPRTGLGGRQTLSLGGPGQRLLRGVLRSGFAHHGHAYDKGLAGFFWQAPEENDGSAAPSAEFPDLCPHRSSVADHPGVDAPAQEGRVRRLDAEPHVASRAHASDDMKTGIPRFQNLQSCILVRGRGRQSARRPWNLCPRPAEDRRSARD
jgi:hypothetical protein